MKHGPSLATILALYACVFSPVPARANDGSGAWWAPRMRSNETAGNEAQGMATEDPTVPVAAVLPNASLTKTIAQLRKSALGTEPNTVAYFDLVGAGKATAAQVNDLAAYLAKRGAPKVALTFQEYAVRLDPNNATLWLNLGTIQRTNRSMGDAVASFKKAIAIDPAGALAHYNLGAVYDAQKQYDPAIEEYRRALVLDPDLADPRKNPQVVNNDNMLAVKLQLYSNQAGALGLPLLQMQKPSPHPKAAPDKP
jgi:tetratricopeptide (TPR) repeat protein